MPEKTTMTVRLNKEVEAKLARLAARTGYKKSRLAAAAITAYVDADAAESEALERAVAEADAGGPFYDHDEVMRYLEARARGERPPRPDPVRDP
jgi:predicted transcriptional regulator